MFLDRYWDTLINLQFPPVLDKHCDLLEVLNVFLFKSVTSFRCMILIPFSYRLRVVCSGVSTHSTLSYWMSWDLIFLNWMSCHPPTLPTTGKSWRVLDYARVPTEACHVDLLGNFIWWFLLSVPVTSCKTVLINSKILFLYSEPELIFLQQYWFSPSHVGTSFHSPGMENWILEKLSKTRGGKLG